MAALIHVNLYEGMNSVHVQLVGTTSFSPGENPERDYWPGEETFSTGEDIFEIPFTVAGADWREWSYGRRARAEVHLSSVLGASCTKPSFSNETALSP